MRPPLPLERPELRSQLSQEIILLEIELLDLEQKLAQVQAWLDRKWQIDARLVTLRSQEQYLTALET